MTDRPMTFKDPMVRALLAGTKTQTRRVLKPAADVLGNSDAMWPVYLGGRRIGTSVSPDRAAPYAPGDRLWVRETWGMKWPDPKPEHVIYRADSHELGGWRSPAHMPRWASRLTLTVTDVRMQRVQEISEADAVAEGVEPVLVPPDGGSCPHVEGFAALWSCIHGPDAWDANPWVAALTFTVERRNIDGGEA